MKKIAGIILAAALFAMPVYAADSDIASLSDEELQELQTNISQELSDRAAETAEVLTGGDYTGGQDIRAGRYIFSLPADSEDHAALVYLFASVEDTEDNDKKLESGWVDERNNLCFGIADGQVLRIREDVVATLVPVLPFKPDAGSPDSLTAFDEDTDLSSLSDEELEELQTTAAEELTDRSLEVKGLLNAGCYVAGVDIKPGRYVLSLPAEDIATRAYLFDSADDYRNDGEELESGWVDDDESMSLTVNDGQALYVREDVVAALVPDLPSDQPETETATDTTSDTTATEVPSITDPEQILSEVQDRVWETTEEGEITISIELNEGGEGVAKETDGIDTMEYPAKWTIQDGKLLFTAGTKTFSIAYNGEGGTGSLLLYDDSDQLKGIFTSSDQE